jgi:RNA polymerase-binding transcription factor DksA
MARVQKAHDGGATPSRALPGSAKKPASRAASATTATALGSAVGPKTKAPAGPGAKPSVPKASPDKAGPGKAAVPQAEKAAAKKPAAEAAPRTAVAKSAPVKAAVRTPSPAAGGAPAPKHPAAPKDAGAKPAAKATVKAAPQTAGKAVEPKPAADAAAKGAPKARAGAATPAATAPEPKAPVKTGSPPAAKAAVRKEIPRRTGPLDKFLLEQRQLLFDERATHLRQAESLKEEADALAAEMEPGESEFGEEGGEGGNLSIERELDLVLSAQAKASVEEIDRALVKIEIGTYGLCEKCGKEIPRARLKALPHAPLCVACKSGGLSRR